ncbi:hypothetical protein [Methanobacterium ferruginis]|uniref:hypothetical protein n=1 Tax=Methanobacterium ferruginis TaxID=710191 RepID=UPI002573D1E1|nr:hypothetical protein [Methanobacterium ferruginis]BDZ68620.1 hypothetical protein GCM10025860_20680 [Methanobacterium ferruginis]
MRYTYGIMDRKNVLMYKPQLFQKTDDLLVFPSKDFQKWHSNLTEYLDGIYQINSKNIETNRYVDIEDLKLALGVLYNLNEELESIFNQEKKYDFSYQYISTVNDLYKKRQGNYYGRYMYKIDRKVFKVTPQIKWIHMMEILDEVHRMWSKHGTQVKRLNLVHKKYNLK